jgi:hypothetical protein
MTRSLRPSGPKNISRARARPKPHIHDPASPLPGTPPL